MLAYLHGLTGAERPRLLHLPTAAGDDDWSIAATHAMFPPSEWETAHLRLFGVPASGWRELVLRQDVIWVNGGNTANLLAVWRAQGFDRVVREAWERGAVLAGWSAGAICWFEASVTDSFRVDLDGMRDGLGLLAGSCCPHYDGEARRRPVYHELIASGFPAGYAVDDGAGLLFRGPELEEVVSFVPGATAYRVELREGQVVEEPLPAREL
jgi:peptidase E